MQDGKTAAANGAVIDQIEAAIGKLFAEGPAGYFKNVQDIAVIVPELAHAFRQLSIRYDQLDEELRALKETMGRMEARP